MTSVNYNIQIKNITFTKNYIKQLIESIYKTTVNELFNAAHSEIQIHRLTSKIYKIVFNFQIVLKSARDVTVSRFITIFNSKLTFQDFSNLVHQIDFGVLTYCDLTNKTILINIELAHLLSVFILRAQLSQLSSIALFSHSSFLLLTVTFIDVTISFIFTFIVLRYSFFISSAFVTSFIFAFKKIDFIIFHFRIHFERKIIKIIFIEIFDYQITKDKNLNVS